MKTKALGVFFAFLMAGTTAFAQMGGGQGGQGNMNHSDGWLGGGMWFFALIGVVVVALLIVVIKKQADKKT